MAGEDSSAADALVTSASAGTGRTAMAYLILGLAGAIIAAVGVTAFFFFDVAGWLDDLVAALFAIAGLFGVASAIARLRRDATLVALAIVTAVDLHEAADRWGATGHYHESGVGVEWQEKLNQAPGLVARCIAVGDGHAAASLQVAIYRAQRYTTASGDSES